MKNIYCVNSFSPYVFENVELGNVLNGIDKDGNKINWTVCLISKETIETIDIVDYFIRVVTNLADIMESNGYSPTHIFVSGFLHHIIRVSISARGMGVNQLPQHHLMSNRDFYIFGIKVVPFNTVHNKNYVINMTDFDWNEVKPLESHKNKKIDRTEKFPVKVIV